MDVEDKRIGVRLIWMMVRRYHFKQMIRGHLEYAFSRNLGQFYR